MADDSRQVCITDSIHHRAIRELVSLRAEVVVVGDALRRGLRIMAANAMDRIQLLAELLPVSQRDLWNLDFRALAGRIGSRSDNLVLASHAAQADVRGELAVWTGQSVIRLKDRAAGRGEAHQSAGNRGAFGVVHLDDDGLIQLRPDAGRL